MIGQLVRRLRAEPRLAAAVAAVIVIVLVAAGVGVARSSEDEPRPSRVHGVAEGPFETPRRGPDTVPELPDLPDGCGVSKRTAKALVPLNRYEDPDDCVWLSQSGASGHKKVLTVKVDQLDTSRNMPATSAYDTAFGTLSPPAERVDGLGEQAISRFSSVAKGGRGEYVFTARGRYYAIVYEGYEQGRPISKEVALAGARRAAIDVARKLGLPAKPTPHKKDDPQGPSPLHQVPQACRLVSAETLGKVVRDGVNIEPWKEEPLLAGFRDVHVTSCRWKADKTVDSKTQSADLTVEVASVSDYWPGAGYRAASHGYAGLQRRSRGVLKEFRPLGGLGEQAFGGHMHDFGHVGFRVRNVVVLITYKVAPLPTGEDDVAGAYTVALDVARRLQR
ncbi:hypothetical protein E1287_18340 [Actinomadura sp. KC06]|uniref:hypothetical protein n=1 Tax=Actinomadura sp. KC06 TaxID=2530369 RepID=UPI00104A292C|nr:hypothetical protein [Actinomadura sp. KC06]TDD33904.1 hypothetical protein E1287_18340 [Actinomadura sp. KC06]